MQDALDITITKLNIAGYNVRELVCKNDNCRTLLGWEKVRTGVVILFCPECKKTSVFHIRYSKMAENVDTLLEEFTLKGGEKI